MFDTPAHASYIAFCRELRLERRPFEYGDVWCFWKPTSGGPYIVGAAGNEGADEFAVWLPRLDQWLEKLDEAGIEAVLFTRADGVSQALAYPLSTIHALEPGPPSAPTREEAAALLWMAVTGRKATT